MWKVGGRWGKKAKRVSFLAFEDGTCMGQPDVGPADDGYWGLEDASLGCFKGRWCVT